MLLIIAGVLVVLWAVAVMLSFLLGGFIHLLLLVAILLIVMRLFDGKKTIPGG